MDIHCKELYGEEYRRFVLHSTDFKTLFETVKRLFTLPDSCVLKYKDDEGDLVTMSSDEELSSALDFSSGLLHLFVVNSAQPPDMMHHREHHFRHHPCGNGNPHKWGKKGCKREKKWEKKWEKKFEKRGGCNRHHNPEILKKRIAWLSRKRDAFQLRSNELETIKVTQGLLPPGLLQEQQFLEKKLAGISSRLEKLSLLSNDLESQKGSIPDPETLPDIPKEPLSESEKEKILQELREIRENVYPATFAATKESKFKVKDIKSALQNLDPADEKNRERLQAELEVARGISKENKKVLKSIVHRERELCNLLGLDKKEYKLRYKFEKHCAKHYNKKAKNQFQ